jgi:autoinducer 2-degrading protein
LRLSDGGQSGRFGGRKKGTMLIVHVHVHVKPESVEQFKAASIANARESIKEPGITRFDIVQQQDDSTRFVLIEVYRSVEATAAHKATRHYEIWRDTVAPMMTEPRSSVKFAGVFPNEEHGESGTSQGPQG